MTFPTRAHTADTHKPRPCEPLTVSKVIAMLGPRDSHHRHRLQGHVLAQQRAPAMSRLRTMPTWINPMRMRRVPLQCPVQHEVDHLLRPSRHLSHYKMQPDSRTKMRSSYTSSLRECAFISQSRCLSLSLSSKSECGPRVFTPRVRVCRVRAYSSERCDDQYP